MFFEDRLKLFKESYVVNWHEHVWFDREKKLNEFAMERLMNHAEILGIDMTVVSLPLTGGYNKPEDIELANDTAYEALKRYPKTMRGMAFIDPINGRYAVEEIKRCVEGMGFVGVKLYHQFFMDDPAQYPIIEKCIELNVPILMHAGKIRRDQQHTQPRISDSTHMIPAAKRYPEATFIMAHITGGGDWYWQLKGMEDCKNIFTDVSGSVHDTDSMERTAKVMGVDRMLFGSDGSYASCVGKMLSCELSDEEVKTILGNPRFLKYLERGAR